MKKAKAEKGRAPGAPAASRRFSSWPIVAALFAIIALFLWPTWKTDRRLSSTSIPKTNAENVAIGRDSSLPEPEQDRALRGEQLQAAEKLLAEFPQNDDVVYLAGLVRNEQGDSETAMKLWQRSLELDSTRADAHESLGYALLLRDDYARAEAHFRQALEINPHLETARFRLAAALSHQGKFNEVVSVTEKAGTLSAEAYRLLGDASLHLKE